MVKKKPLVMELIRQAPQYGIDQSQVSIYVVATPQDWAYCEARLLRAHIVGLDTETRPVFNKTQAPNPCALLQLAVRDAENKEEVFILDLLSLSADLYSPTLSTVFLSDDVVKLGLGFHLDLQGLAQSYPSAPCFTVCKNFVEVNDMSAVVTGGHLPISLQKLVFFYLRRRLSKSQQLSNWGRRPLSFSQIHYAAADALALLDLYDELLLRSERNPSKLFHVGVVTATIDVNKPAAPSKCSFCFESFNSAAALKKHRQEKLCPTQEHKLQVCPLCKLDMLAPTPTMQQHVDNCTAS